VELRPALSEGRDIRNPLFFGGNTASKSYIHLEIGGYGKPPYVLFTAKGAKNVKVFL
jgi:hypothetical protein